MKIKIPKAAGQIIARLEQNGYQAFVVGGCVRDSVMGRCPNDWDICTSALPEQVIQCFEGFRIFKTGLKHGTITIMIKHLHYEVTTFRIDGKYLDNRRPDQVEFVTSIKDDLSRRDFTINAMAYNSSTGLVDYYDGVCDIRKKLICCVGKPDDRFQEDALRIMRALRFASVLGFSIEEATSLSMEHNKEFLHHISVERVREELCQLLLGVGVASILCDYINIFLLIIPEIKPMIGFAQNNPHHHLDVWQHTIQAIVHSPQDLVVRLTMLFHDIGKPQCYTQDISGIGHFYGHAQHSADIAFDVMKRLKFSNKMLSNVKDLILYHDADLQPRNKYIKRWLHKIGEEKLRQLIQVKRADAMSHAKKYLDERLEQLAAVEHCLDEVMKEHQCFTLKDLAVRGRDLLAIGIPQGPQINLILSWLVNMVINEHLENDKEKLLEALKAHEGDFCKQEIDKTKEGSAKNAESL